MVEYLFAFLEMHALVSVVRKSFELVHENADTLR